MQDLKLEGKKVAVFGMGDSISYAENYADGTGELHDIFQDLGCTMLGFTSQEGYEHEESKAARGDQFCGLLLDNVNFEELTEGRVEAWVAQLKEEGIMEGAPAAAAAPVAEPVTVAATPVAAAAVDDNLATATIIAQLEKENAALREQLLHESSSQLLATSEIASADGYAPHYNSITGKTMWTSADGRSCYYTDVGASTKVSP
jgi:flavodoxin I